MGGRGKQATVTHVAGWAWNMTLCSEVCKPLIWTSTKDVMTLIWGVYSLPWPPQPIANREHEAAESGFGKGGFSVLVAG